jgi:hypothetical protein
VTRNLFSPVVRRRLLAAAVVSVVVLGAGCRSKQGGQDAGTSTGLPYRPNGTPSVVELPPGYPIYPTPKPAVR